MNNAVDYLSYAHNTFQLISSEIDSFINQNDAEQLEEFFPKAVVMFEFFRYIRGEAFSNLRPTLGDEQKKLYEMENIIKGKLLKIKEVLEQTGRLDSEKMNFNKEKVWKI
jgi:hypothetical protein